MNVPLLRLLLMLLLTAHCHGLSALCLDASAAASTPSSSAAATKSSRRSRRRRSRTERSSGW
jgi:hypothetical protein